jgi:hypothetical protein
MSCSLMFYRLKETFVIVALFYYIYKGDIIGLLFSAKTDHPIFLRVYPSLGRVTVYVL